MASQLGLNFISADDCRETCENIMAQELLEGCSAQMIGGVCVLLVVLALRVSLEPSLALHGPAGAGAGGGGGVGGARGVVGGGARGGGNGSGGIVLSTIQPNANVSIDQICGAIGSSRCYVWRMVSRLIPHLYSVLPSRFVAECEKRVATFREDLLTQIKSRGSDGPPLPDASMLHGISDSTPPPVSFCSDEPDEGVNGSSTPVDSNVITNSTARTLIMPKKPSVLTASSKMTADWGNQLPSTDSVLLSTVSTPPTSSSLSTLSAPGGEVLSTASMSTLLASSAVRAKRKSWGLGSIITAASDSGKIIRI